MHPHDVDPGGDATPPPKAGLRGPLGRAMVRMDTWANWLSRAALTIMLVLILVQVFTRYILNDPIEGVIGATEFYLMPIIVFGSLSYLEMHDGHVRVGILFDALPDPLITVDAQSRLVYANAAARVEPRRVEWSAAAGVWCCEAEQHCSRQVRQQEQDGQKSMLHLQKMRRSSGFFTAKKIP